MSICTNCQGIGYTATQPYCPECRGNGIVNGNNDYKEVMPNDPRTGTVCDSKRAIVTPPPSSDPMAGGNARKERGQELVKLYAALYIGWQEVASMCGESSHTMIHEQALHGIVSHVAAPLEAKLEKQEREIARLRGVLREIERLHGSWKVGKASEIARAALEGK